jgi:predicted small lipoprotein YifL
MKVSESRAICYAAAGQGGPVVTRSGGIWLSKIVLAGAVATALALAGCGRKGGLDEPPLAASEPAPPGQPGAATSDGKPNPPAAEKRRTFLDWLID